MRISEHAPLAPRTTLGLGGAARWLVEPAAIDELAEALAFAEQRGAPAFVLGGGSNVVVGDDGFPGVVIAPLLTGLHFTEGEVIAGAAEPLDRVVAATVERGLCGLEALSGIPGTIGATPIQNVGAYGQEIGDSLVSIEVFDRRRRAVESLPRAALGLGYRTSALKGRADAPIVCGLRLALAATPAPIRYAELERRVGAVSAPPAVVRAAVLSLRRAKSMVLDPDDPNRRSVGSFFTNPIVSPAVADAIDAPGPIPRWPAEGGVKLSAGWLIEAAGFAKGHREGAVGLSSRHALALVHHGGGTTALLLDLARRIRDRVAERFGVVLVPEPVIVGTSW